MVKNDQNRLLICLYFIYQSTDTFIKPIHTTQYMKQTNIRCKNCEKSITICNSVKFAKTEIEIAKKYNTPYIKEPMVLYTEVDNDEKEIAQCLRSKHEIELIN